jgi:hypothetical protein
MEATPFAQVVVVALAIKETGEVTVAPLFGLVTVTVAKAGAANDRTIQNRRIQTREWMVFITRLRCGALMRSNPTQAGRGRTSLSSSLIVGDGFCNFAEAYAV